MSIKYYFFVILFVVSITVHLPAYSENKSDIHTLGMLAFENIIEELNRFNYPTTLVRQCSILLDSVTFANTDDVVPTYFIDQNRIELPKSFRDSKNANRIKRFSEMGPSAAGTIMHECWHCYLNEEISKQPNYGDFYGYYKMRYSALYGAFPNRYRDEIHDEAHAVAVQDFSSLMFIYKRYFFEIAKTCDQKKAFIINEGYKKKFERTLWGQYEGYYINLAGNQVFSKIFMDNTDLTKLWDVVFGKNISFEFANNFPLPVDCQEISYP